MFTSELQFPKPPEHRFNGHSTLRKVYPKLSFISNERLAVMEININRTGLKLFVIVAVIVACYLFIDNNPEVQESIKEVLRTIYLIN